MKKIASKLIKIIIIVLTVFVMSFNSVRCEESSEDLSMINCYFSTYNKIINWNFPYSDEWFKGDSHQYNHRLCQGTLGLCVSGFRIKGNELGHQQDALLNYYEKVGFENIEVYGYDMEPTDYSISNGIATKQIDDFTLMAISICGSNYKDEWVSNLTVNDLIRHAGFDSAAYTVELRIRDYIRKYNIKGNVKLWITGFSRAAATSNLVAADMTDSGFFTDVFAYTFATPNNTTVLKEYSNIYNIVGKNDPVPYVALNEWGYYRYGTTLYTPSREADSDFYEKYERAYRIFEQTAGTTLIASPAINNSVKVVLSSLLEMIPSRNEYIEYYQEEFIKTWHAKSNISVANIIGILEDFLEIIAEKGVNTQKEANNLAEYILNISMYYFSGSTDNIYANDWYDNANLGLNLAREHLPLTYLSWLFSSNNPDDIFSDNLDYNKLIIHGDVDVEIYDSEGLFQEICANGNSIKPIYTESNTSVSSNPTSFYFYQLNDETTIFIPKDKSYVLKVISSEDFYYYGSSYIDRDLNGLSIQKCECKGDLNGVYILSSASRSDYDNKDGYELEYITNEHTNPSFILALENTNVFHLTFSKIKTFAIMNAFIILIAIILIIYSSIKARLQKRKKQRSLIFMEHALFIFTFIMLEEASAKYLNVFPMLRGVFGVLSLLTIIHLCYCSIGHENQKLSKFMMISAIIVSISNILLKTYSIDICILIYCVAIIVLAMGIVKISKPTKKDLILIAAISMILILILYKYFYLSRNVFISMSIFIVCLVGMNVFATHLSIILRVTIAAFMLPGVLNLFELYFGYDSLIHTIVLVGYALILIVSSGILEYINFARQRDEKKQVLQESHIA